VEPGGHSWVVRLTIRPKCHKTLVRTTPLRNAPPLQRTQFCSSKRLGSPRQIFGGHRHRNSLRNIEPAIVKKPASLNLFWNSRQRVTARAALLTTIPSCQSAPLPTRFYRPAGRASVNSWVSCCVPRVPNAESTSTTR
jgi:hypothetical protein